jgi:predicted nucleic acid-binding protein
VPERFFFDTSAFLADIRREPEGDAVFALRERLRRTQCFTSVLVVYELYRGVPLSHSKRKSQIQVLDTWLSTFTLKPVHEAHAMMAAKLHRYSKGSIDPLLAAQCLDGDFTMVTTNRQDFERVPELRIYNFPDATEAE